MSIRRDRTVILVAGLCGLSAAYHLEEKAETTEGKDTGHGYYRLD